MSVLTDEEILVEEYKQISPYKDLEIKTEK